MPKAVRVGDLLGEKYKVERVLGTGGMGMVVAARHLQLGEQVAIKLLLPHALEDATTVERFLREGRISARLGGEHTARVFDIGTLDDGAPFLVMEYLDGSDLGAILREGGPLPVDTAVDYMLQVCEAIADAHAGGVIHRDLKPSNLFLIKLRNGAPSIKVIDFGISKLLHSDGEGSGNITQSAAMIGSPLFMAPEQMLSSRDVDARCDIWSIGAILHMLLTGAPPFKGATVFQIYELIKQGPPSLKGARPDVPAALEAVVHRCLQRDRAARYTNVAELAAALAPFGSPHASASAVRVSRLLRVPLPGLTNLESGPPPALSWSPADAADAAHPAARKSGAPSPGMPPRGVVSSTVAASPLGTVGSASTNSGSVTDAGLQASRSDARQRGRLLVASAVMLAAAALGVAALWYGSRQRPVEAAASSVHGAEAARGALSSAGVPVVAALRAAASTPVNSPGNAQEARASVAKEAAPAASPGPWMTPTSEPNAMAGPAMNSSTLTAPPAPLRSAASPPPRLARPAPPPAPIDLFDEPE